MKELIPLLLETERLKLRMFKEEDWAPLCEMFANKECVRYTLKEPLPDWLTWRWLAAYLGHWQLRGYGPYAVIEKESDQLIGPVGLWFPGDWPEPEIKWSIRQKFWGKGYVSEAAVAIKQLAKDKLKWKRLISLIDPANQRSIAVSKRIGGSYEKTIPFRDGQADMYVYKLV